MKNAGSKLAHVQIYNITQQIHGLHTRPSGCGGQSDVYAAYWDRPVEYMPVAVKVLRFAGNPDERVRKRLDSEIFLWARVSHPNVQRLLGVCFVPTSALPAMVSEWHSNGDITAYLQTKLHDPDLQPIRYRLLIEVVEGVGYLHEHDIVHGDIKGANVLIAKDGSARLSDFGFSLILTEHSRSRSQWSAAKGTIRWMAPEFFDEDDRVATHTRASDVWAIGCLIIEVQTGDLPYSTKRFEPSVILAISRGELPAPQPFEPDALWQLMRICCQAEPSARYTTSRLLSRLRIERLTLYLETDLPSELDPPHWCNAALLDVRDHIRGCAISHSPLEPSVRKVLGLLPAARYWEEELGGAFKAIQYSASILLEACVDGLQQQPPTDTAIQFMITNVPSLLRVWRRANRYEEYLPNRPTYSADILRPLVKVLSEHGDTSVALILMHFFAHAPALFKIGRGDSGASTSFSRDAPEVFALAEHHTAWSTDGTLFAIADGEYVTIIQPGKAPSRILELGKSSVDHIAVSPDGQCVACSSTSGVTVTVSLWDIPSQSALDIGTTPAHIGRALNLVFSHDGLCFASTHYGYYSRTAYVWRLGKNPVQLDMPPGALPSAVAFTADSRIIVAWVWEESYRSAVTLRFYDLDAAALVTIPEVTVPSELHFNRFSILAMDSQYLMLPAFSPDRLYLYDSLSGQLVCCLEAGDWRLISCAASSLDGAYAAAGNMDGFVYVWDVKTRRLLENSPLPVHRDSITRLTFTSDGTTIITMTEKGEVCVSDIRGSWPGWDL